MYEENIKSHFTDITLGVWDSNQGDYTFLPKYATLAENSIRPGEATITYWEYLGNNLYNFNLNANSGNIMLIPGYRFFFKTYYHADNFATNYSLAKNIFRYNANEMYNISGETKGIAIFVGRITSPQTNVSKYKLIVNLPQDAYHWSEPIIAYPDYKVEFDSGRTSLVWDMKNKESENARLISVAYKVHENELKKDLDKATIASLEYAKKADYWGQIALIIAILSLPSAIWSSRDFIKWIKEKIKHRP